MNPRVVMYTTRYCGYCERARRLLRARGIAFDEIDLTRDPAGRRRVIAQTGHPTVPVILLDGELIGGSDELHALDRSGELDQLLGA
ncbi:MAG: glutathione S-transferase N-terminal domain-containing protein [Kofleriaceae bacterium]|nr:glutathione S-transferase N-terminal domain-containing protein [Myxococcales bacterium]MCB9560725.1 glutathione S-transferase N-terminal domain-containing protein [Kofleriaceae bacterium]MCB9574487.1 glutathione S-transferase N-terminal domain-containing protein [Kofleriaceae bacterium]